MRADFDGAELSDERLALEARQGCPASFEQLVRRFQVPLLHFLQGRTTSVEDAEDLTQDVFVRAYENLHRYCPRWRFSTWLFTIARRLTINHYRKQPPWSDGDAPLSAEAADRGPEQHVEEQETRQRIWDLAATVLTEPQWTGLWLHYVEDLSAREIAKVLGRSRTSVKTMLFRARRRLASVLADELVPSRTAAERNAGVASAACCFAPETDHV
jgi:RNA polymerase sigma-70 factor (ECF subfamily)